MPKLIDFVSQDDTHSPTLTVEETLEFAWRSTTAGHHSYSFAKDAGSAQIFDEADAKLIKVSISISKTIMTINFLLMISILLR